MNNITEQTKKFSTNRLQMAMVTRKLVSSFKFKYPDNSILEEVETKRETLEPDIVRGLECLGDVSCTRVFKIILCGSHLGKKEVCDVCTKHVLLFLFTIVIGFSNSYRFWMGWPLHKNICVDS